MKYTTRFYKIGMFQPFKLPGNSATLIRVGRNTYRGDASAVFKISSLGKAVQQVVNQYEWTTT